jgi:predicted enzyme related to lactoylglutathione lyase
MPEFKQHKPGTFSWADLATTDPAAAKRFYSEVFSWKTEDLPIPQGGTYTMARVNGKDVAAIAGMMPEQKAKGMPPYWNPYVTVANVDDTVKKATSLGAKTIMPPFDVTDAGRMAVIADPSGAAFSVWQSKRHIGAALLNEPGAICWVELESRNVDVCRTFYSKLFGWNPEMMQGGGMPYTVFKDGTEYRAGMMATTPQTPPSTPSHWTIYFQVTNCDATTKKVNSSGGKTIVPPTDIPNVGRFAWYFDPQGALFGVLQPAK